MRKLAIKKLLEAGEWAWGEYSSPEEQQEELDEGFYRFHMQQYFAPSPVEAEEIITNKEDLTKLSDEQLFNALCNYLSDR